MKFYHQNNKLPKGNKTSFGIILIFGSSFRLYVLCSWFLWVFWQAPSHFWASSATIEGTSEKLHQQRDNDGNFVHDIPSNLEDLRSFSGYAFVFLSYLIVQKRFVHFIVNSSHLGRSWRQLPKKLQMQLGALRGAANQPDPAVGRTSLIDFNLRQRSIMIYVWICEMITVSTIVEVTVISWSCKAFFAHQSQCEWLESFVHHNVRAYAFGNLQCGTKILWLHLSRFQHTIYSTISLWHDVGTWDTKMP